MHTIEANICLSVYLLIYLFVHISVGLFNIVLFSMKLFFCVCSFVLNITFCMSFWFFGCSVCLFVCLSICLFVYLSFCLFGYLFVYLFSRLFVLVILSPPVRISQNSFFSFFASFIVLCQATSQIRIETFYDILHSRSDSQKRN